MREVTTPAAAWYPDPSNPNQARYWDGVRWTEHTQQIAPTPPVPKPQPAPAAPQMPHAPSMPPTGFNGPTPPMPPTHTGVPAGFTTPTGPASYGAPGSAKPESYLVWAILTTIFCALPLGVVAIVNATKVDSAWAVGNFAEAQRRSEAAKKWSIAAAVAPIALFVIFFVVALIVGAATGFDDTSALQTVATSALT